MNSETRLKDSVFLNKVNENENKIEEDSSLKSVCQLTKTVPSLEINLPIPDATRSSSECQVLQKSFTDICNASCSLEDSESRKDTSPSWQEEDEYFQTFQPNPLLLMKQLSCQELDFLSF